jgi:hypothetical protein
MNTDRLWLRMKESGLRREREYSLILETTGLTDNLEGKRVRSAIILVTWINTLAALFTSCVILSN